MAVLLRVPQRGQQTVVLGDVVGGAAEKAVELVDERALLVFDAHAVTGRARDCRARRRRCRRRSAIYAWGDGRRRFASRRRSRGSAGSCRTG